MTRWLAVVAAVLWTAPALAEPPPEKDWSFLIAPYIWLPAMTGEASVRGIVQKVNLGEADAGVVYSSDARMNPAGTGFLTPPDSVNVTAHYPIAPLTRSEGASMFIDFVLSDQGQRILHNYGFGPPAIIKEDKP